MLSEVGLDVSAGFIWMYHVLVAAYRQRCVPGEDGTDRFISTWPDDDQSNVALLRGHIRDSHIDRTVVPPLAWHKVLHHVRIFSFERWVQFGVQSIADLVNTLPDVPPDASFNAVELRELISRRAQSDRSALDMIADRRAMFRSEDFHYNAMWVAYRFLKRDIPNLRAWQSGLCNSDATSRESG